MSKARLIAAMLAIGVCHAAVGLAHHSFAMFDASKTITNKGVVQQVQWTNPHVWVRISVKESGKSVTYGYEAAAIAVLKRAGWSKDSVKAGDVVTVVGHPYKDGRVGGSIDHLILADGRSLGTGDAIPGAFVVPGVQP
jgi:Family of unknown function (DUF6152)